MKKEKIKNNEFYKKLEETLDKQFPKGKCKERGQALVLFAEANNIIEELDEVRDIAFLDNKRLLEKLQRYKEKIMDWCYKNNTIPMKYLFKDLKDSKLELATLDGGWINVFRFKEFLDTL